MKPQNPNQSLRSDTKESKKNDVNIGKNSTPQKGGGKNHKYWKYLDTQLLEKTAPTTQNKQGKASMRGAWWLDRGWGTQSLGWSPPY